MPIGLMMRPPASTWEFDKVEVASLTDVGVRRSHNQDAFGVLLAPTAEVWRERGHILIVADGMGAHAVGELASELAADQIPHTYQKHANQGPEHALRKAFDEANANIHQKGQQNREFQGMGTTSTALLLRPEGVYVAHVGDSRAYRIRGNLVEQLSFDHSLQWELARRQQVSPDSIAGIPSNVIVRSLGPEANVQVDIEGPHQAEPGDIYIICSDGLSNQVTDEELGAISQNLPLTEACQFLVDLANLRGGPDNITVVALRVPGKKPVTEEATAASDTSKKLHQLIPWPALSIVLGALLAIFSLVLTADRSNGLTLGMVLFGISVVLVLMGLVGALLQRKTEKEQEAREKVNDSLQIYRKTPFEVNSALINKMMQTETNLMEIIKEKGWEIDENKLKRLKQNVAVNIKKNDLLTAFVHQCHALMLLTSKMRHYRSKDEQFKPNW